VTKPSKLKYDAIVVGSGPNGLAAAITLVQKGLSVLLVEKNSYVGGGLCSQELTIPGYVHDVFSASHPMAVASPFFKSLSLEKFGLKWIHSPAVLAHPHDDGTATLLRRSVTETAQGLKSDQKRYEKLFEPLVKRSHDLMEEIFKPIFHIPKHFMTLMNFGLRTLCTAESFSRANFKEQKTRALFAGIAAHSGVPLDTVGPTAVGLSLQIVGHSEGWPFPERGAQSLAKALCDCFKSFGGEVVTDFEVKSLEDLPQSEVVLFDLTPKQILRIADTVLPLSVKKSFDSYRYGSGVFKMDWALDCPIPWTAKETGLAMVVHVGGSLDEIVEAEQFLLKGQYSQKPFVLLCQPSIFDSTRAPAGKHTAWAYCHVPRESTHDHSQYIEDQIERFAPGFKKSILKRSILAPKDLQMRNPNLVGGDISGGLVDFKRLLFRPRLTLNPYALDGKRYWICSSSTSPGPGVHGMSGHHAAVAVLKGMNR
jgi:phytoene dehydrogenase-like protein